MISEVGTTFSFQFNPSDTSTPRESSKVYEKSEEEVSSPGVEEDLAVDVNEVITIDKDDTEDSEQRQGDGEIIEEERIIINRDEIIDGIIVRAETQEILADVAEPTVFLDSSQDKTEEVQNIIQVSEHVQNS